MKESAVRLSSWIYPSWSLPWCIPKVRKRNRSSPEARRKLGWTTGLYWLKLAWDTNSLSLFFWQSQSPEGRREVTYRSTGGRCTRHKLNISTIDVMSTFEEHNPLLVHIIFIVTSHWKTFIHTLTLKWICAISVCIVNITAEMEQKDLFHKFLNNISHTSSKNIFTTRRYTNSSIAKITET